MIFLYFLQSLLDIFCKARYAKYAKHALQIRLLAESEDE